MLAEGALAAIRTAGPFEVPWSVGLLPDGSFLVTGGRALQHVRVNADTIAIQGIPSVLYVGHGGLLDIAVDPEFEQSVYLSRAPDGLDPGPRPEQIGRLALSGDGYLYLARRPLGRARAQDLSRRVHRPHQDRRNGPEAALVGRRAGPQGGDELNLFARARRPLATFGDYQGHPIAVNSEQPGTDAAIVLGRAVSLAVETQPATTELWVGAGRWSVLPHCGTEQRRCGIIDAAGTLCPDRRRGGALYRSSDRMPSRKQRRWPAGVC